MNGEIFFTPDPIKDSSNRWRNGIVLVVVLFGVVSLFVWQVGSHFPKVFAWEKIVQKISSDDGVVAKEGGDVTIEPPLMPEPPKLPVLIGELPAETDFSAQGIIVKDEESGMVLYSKNEYEKYPIASVTKLMSLLVLLDRKPNWSTTTTVAADDMPDVHMYKDDTYTLSELWQSSSVGSSNKAVVTLVDALGYSREDFVEMMNGKAKELGMVDSEFADPTGLDVGNVSTASDLAILLSAALEKVSIEEALKMEELTLYSKERKKTHHMWNTNWLLIGWIPNEFTSVIGKTGYIPESGDNFVSRIESEDGRKLIVVVLGADSHDNRFIETREVASWAFKAYEWPSE